MPTIKPKRRVRAFAPLATFLATLSAAAIGGLPLSGQDADTTGWRIPNVSIVSAASGLSLALVPSVFSINDGLPSCAPCDPETLPGIDRWAVSTVNGGWDAASTVAEYGLLAGTWYELYKLPNGADHLAASIEGAVWNFGLTHLGKALFNRNRPVLYTEDAIEAQQQVNNHRSMYSGHTSTSFGLATSYVLSMSHKKGLGRFWPFIVATGVGVMRVAAAKHFPTDVLVGAVMGTGTSFVVHKIRF